MPKKTLDSYSIMAKIYVDVSIDISASSFEEALNKANELDVENFVEMLGECNDSKKPTVYCLYRNDE